MALLQNLPEELLTEIVSYLADDKPLLCKVAIQSKRLGELVRPFLAREVRFVTRPSSKSFRLFIRSTGESTVFASMVRDLLLEWDQGISTTHDLMNRLLRRLPQLRSLTLQALWDNDPWTHQYLKKNPMEFLTVLDLNIQHLTTDDVVKYIFLKRLEYMSISWINKPTIPRLPQIISYGDSNVSSLKLRSGVHLPEDVLHEILKYPRSLKTLVTNLPGRDDPNNYFRPVLPMTTPLSPAGVTRALEPTMVSLTQLTVLNENCEWPNYDCSRTDLSSFICLKKLQIASRCYFLAGSSKRDGIVHLLPASLEDLEILFDLRSSIRPLSNQDFSDHVISNPSGEMTPDCNWLVDLAMARMDGTLPALRKVTLTERACAQWSVPDPAYESVNWNVPHIVMKAFRDAGIELTATARATTAFSDRGCLFEHVRGYRSERFFHVEGFRITYYRDPPISAVQSEASS